MSNKYKDTSLLKRMGSDRTRELGEEIMKGILKKADGSLDMKLRRHERNEIIYRRVMAKGGTLSEEFMRMMEEEKLDYEKALARVMKKRRN